MAQHNNKLTKMVSMTVKQVFDDQYWIGWFAYTNLDVVSIVAGKKPGKFVVTLADKSKVTLDGNVKLQSNLKFM